MPTEMIERYLQAVKFWLPSRQKNDIIAELSDDLHAQLEEREAGLGHTLSEDEIEALLRQRGSPIMVANGYLPQQSLIGPLLFPIYLFVLKIVLACCVGPWLVAAIIQAIVHAANSPVHLVPDWIEAMKSIVGTLWSITFSFFGAVTLGFAILERVQSHKHFLEEWNLRKLPPVRDPNHISRANSTFEIVVNLIFLTWWVTYMHATTYNIGPSFQLTLNPVWYWFFWLYFAIALINIGHSSMSLLRPWWTPLRAALRLAVTIVSSAMFCILLKMDVLAGIVEKDLPSDKAAAFTHAFNYWTGAVAFPVCLVVGLIVAGTDIYRIVRLLRAKGEPTLFANVSPQG